MTSGRSRPEPIARQLIAADAARDLAEMLASIEVLRPGLARNRALAIGNTGKGDSLGEHFTSVELLGSADLARAAVADETIDFVYAAADTPMAAAEMIGAALRALRLLGVAVIDLASGEPPRNVPGDAVVPPEATISIVGCAPDAAGLTVTVANAGARAVGSAVLPLRLEARGLAPGGGAAPMAATSSSVTLFVGCATDLRLPLDEAAISDTTVLELSVVTSGWLWESRSPGTLVAFTPFSVAAVQAQGSAPNGDLLDRWVIAAATEAGGEVIGVHPHVGDSPARRYVLGRA